MSFLAICLALYVQGDLSDAREGRSYGRNFAFCVDLDEDGRAEYLVSHQGDASGAVYVHSGRTGELLRRIGGRNDEMRFGSAIAISKDGKELLARVLGSDDKPLVARHSLVDGGRLSQCVPPVADKELAWDLFDIGDSLLISTISVDDNKELGYSVISSDCRTVLESGRIERRRPAGCVVRPLDGRDDSYAILGSTVTLRCRGDEAPLAIFSEPLRGYGRDVVYLGDINDDGGDEVLVSCSGLVSGVAFVYSIVDGSLVCQLTDPMGSEHFAQAIAAMGDVDADAITDFAISRWHLLSGGVRIYSGRSCKLIREVHLPYADDALVSPDIGWKLASGGDVDNDGIYDLIVSVYSPGFQGAGQGVVLFSGRTGEMIRRHRLSDLDQ